MDFGPAPYVAADAEQVQLGFPGEGAAAADAVDVDPAGVRDRPRGAFDGIEIDTVQRVPHRLQVRVADDGDDVLQAVVGPDLRADPRVAPCRGAGPALFPCQHE